MMAAKVPDMAEYLRKVVSGEAPPPPVQKLIGFRLTRAEGGEASFDLDVEERHHNPMGTLHGGVIVDVADAAMGCAFASVMERGDTYTTMAALSGSTIRAERTPTPASASPRSTRSPCGREPDGSCHFHR